MFSQQLMSYFALQQRTNEFQAFEGHTLAPCVCDERFLIDFYVEVWNSKSL